MTEHAFALNCGVGAGQGRVPDGRPDVGKQPIIAGFAMGQATNSIQSFPVFARRTYPTEQLSDATANSKKLRGVVCCR